MATVLERLAATIAARKDADPAASHTAALFAKGPAKCAEKFGEEAVEAIVEAVRGDRARLTGEAADVLYHLLVMLASRDVPLAEVLAELERREGVSGVAEKAARGPGVSVRRVSDEAGIARCLAIRELVFIEEQAVPAELEVDGLDPRCRHYLATLGAEPVGAARVLPQDGRAKIQRVAVVPAARGQGVGLAIMQRILDDLAHEPGMAEAWLESQIHAVAFYEALGFVAEGEEFLDAGIPHLTMRKKLSAG